MKRDYLALLPIVSVLGIGIALMFKPLPNAPKTEPQKFTQAEVETEPSKTMEEYLHSMADLQNDAILQQLECLHKAENLAICEATEENEQTSAEGTKEPIFEPYAFLPLSADVQNGIKLACDDYKIAYDLIIAICMQESSLNPNCIGDNGKAFGLGQIREEFWNDTANSLGLYDWRTDAVQNATMVCYLMSRQMNDHHLTMGAALNIYRHGVMDDITEPDGKTYVEHIMSNLEWLQNERDKNGNF